MTVGSLRAWRPTAVRKERALARSAIASATAASSSTAAMSCWRKSSHSKTPPAPEPKPPPRETEREPPPKTAAPVTPAPGETPGTGTDVATIKTPGLQFPFPEYLRNIVTQVYRNWDRESARQNSFAEISFLILRDGSVRDIHFVTRSGSFSFDLGAQGAIEAAGNAGGFGPLPDGWDADVLPVSFYFKPISR